MAVRSVNVVLLFNGTSNDNQDEYVTNVVKMHQGLIDDPKQDQIVIYKDGIGNDKQWSALTRWFCQFTGYGAGWVENEAYNTLKQRLSQEIEAQEDGESIEFNVTTGGFSRGAALARDFMNQFVIERLSKDLAKKYPNKSFNIKPFAELLYDCVPSFGIPVDLWIGEKLGIYTQKIDLGFEFSIPEGVRAVHAVSIDEKREAFTPRLIDKSNPLAEEVWFASDHSGVGGGHAIPEGVEDMSDEVPLRYMSQKAREFGLKFSEEFIDKYEVDSAEKSSLGLIQTPSWDNLPKTQVEDREIYVSAKGEHSDMLPVIHESVIDRIKSDPRYRPEALLKLNSFGVLNFDTSIETLEDSAAIAKLFDQPLDPVEIALKMDPTFAKGSEKAMERGIIGDPKDSPTTPGQGEDMKAKNKVAING